MSTAETDTSAQESSSVEYRSEDEKKFALETMNQITTDLETREQASVVFNGIKYSDAYEYNQKRAINYAPPKSKDDDREVSIGIIHEKIVSFVAIFLKYVFKYHIKCYKNGKLIKGMGDVYELAIEFSRKQEEFSKKVALFYWEVFTQGNAFVYEDWVVRTEHEVEAYKDGELLDLNEIDYTYEFLENLTYKDGKMIQRRKAESRLMDGRQVIFGDPEIAELQDQPRITLEDADISMKDAEAMFGTLKMWKKVPKTSEDITALGLEKTTLFDSKRLKDPSKQCIVHYYMDKENNKYNVFVNGVMMLPMDTPFRLFYPRFNYPISNIAAERLTGSIYARSIPAKTKFNADFIDWVLKKMALKFEQGIEPALLAKGKYTLTRDIFRAGNVTHGVAKDDYEKADPENKGLTNSEYGFFGLMKDIIEGQTINPTSSGEVSGDPTATEIAIADTNQQKKLAFLLDGLVQGFFDMGMRRCETVESKYTMKQKETIVDGETVGVYQDFTISIAGVENIVSFDEKVGTEEFEENIEETKGKLHAKAYKSKEKGNPTEFFLVSPYDLRTQQYTLVMEVKPELIKDSQLQMIQMWDEFAKILDVFGDVVDRKKLQEEYLKVSGRSEDLFLPQQLAQDPNVMQQGQPDAYNKGGFGKPRVKQALEQEMLGRSK